MIVGLAKMVEGFRGNDDGAAFVVGGVVGRQPILWTTMDPFPRTVNFVVFDDCWWFCLIVENTAAGGLGGSG